MDRAQICYVLNLIDPTIQVKDCGETHLSVNCLFKDNHTRQDSTSSATISIYPGGTSYYSCFGCSQRGALTTIIRKYAGGVGHKFKRNIDIDLILENAESVRDLRLSKSTLCEGPIEYPDYTAYFKALKRPRKKVKKFLAVKGVTEKAQINLFREHNTLQLVIPYFRAGRCVGMRMRNIYGHSRSKYFMIRGMSFPSREILWGEWLYLIRHPKVLFIVEGELDAACLMQYGLDAVAVGGSGWNMSKQDNLMNNIEPTAVIIAFDADKAGQKGSKQIKESLKESCFAKTVLFDDLRKVPKRRFYVEKEKVAKKIL